ncbi:MAG: hypothetical protein HY655_07715, partial [Acidobacteria bacterium]|nr:hypothetical protein [Acidobacteriota bacterium]
MIPADEAAAFPMPLSEYPAAAGRSLLDILTERIDVDPFNAIATAIFLIAVIHTFAA